MGFQCHDVYRELLESTNMCPNRLDSLNDLSAGLTKLNPKQKLLLIREGPVSLIPKLFEEWNISHLVFEKDTDAYARDRDAQVVAAAEKAGVEVIAPYGRTLWDPDELVKANGGKPTMSASQVESVSSSAHKSLQIRC
jgi:cryptochrome